MLKDSEVISRIKRLETRLDEVEKKVESPEWVKKQFGTMGGRATSEAKQRAARENGKKGWPLPKKVAGHD